jgi:hypothetical protein
MLDSPVDYLESVVGQYVLYQAVLEDLNVDLPLYLAIPATAHRGFLKERIAQVIFGRIGVKLIVFDPEVEEVVEWIR